MVSCHATNISNQVGAESSLSLSSSLPQQCLIGLLIIRTPKPDGQWVDYSVEVRILNNSSGGGGGVQGGSFMQNIQTPGNIMIWVIEFNRWLRLVSFTVEMCYILVGLAQVKFNLCLGLSLSFLGLGLGLVFKFIFKF